MAVHVQLGAMCHLLLALCSIQMCLDLSMTSLGKLAVWLAHGVLALRTFAQLAIPHQATLYRRLCGWPGVFRYFLTIVLLLEMSTTVKRTLAGAVASSQTMHAAQKVVRHCSMHLTILSSTWYAATDQSFARLSLPEWAVFLLAQGNYLATMYMHISCLPGQRPYTLAVILQFTMVLLPCLYRCKVGRQHRQQQAGASQLPSQPTGKSPSSNTVPTSRSQGMGCQQACPEQQSTSHAAWSLKSNSKCKVRQPHISVLGTALQPLCIKIDSPCLEPEHLPSNASQLLADALAQASCRLGDEILMLGMSVRRGCILIAVETFQPKLLGGGSTAADAHSVLQLSQQLLPGLLQSLELAPDTQALAQLMGPGTSLTLQQGAQLVQAKYQPGPASWELAPEPRPYARWQMQDGSLQPPTLGLVQVLQYTAADTCKSIGGSDSISSSCTINDHYSITGSGTRSDPVKSTASDHNTSSSCSGPLSRPPSTYASHTDEAVSSSTVLLEVPVSCRAGLKAMMIQAGQASMQGQSAGVSSEVDSPDALQLYMVGEGSYLPARVVSTTMKAGGTCVVAMVEVQLHADGLVQHHPGGPCAALQPLCLQLWCGKLLLSSSHVLLSLPTPAAAATTDKVVPATTDGLLAPAAAAAATSVTALTTAAAATATSVTALTTGAAANNLPATNTSASGKAAVAVATAGAAAGIRADAAARSLTSNSASGGSMPAGTTANAHAASFGWWGAAPSIAVAAAVELQAAIQQAVRAGEDSGHTEVASESSAALQDLVRDVCYWMSGVRHVACSSGWCAGVATATAQRGLPPAQLAVVYESLSEYAMHRGWSSLHMLLQQQWQQVVKPALRTCSLHVAPQAAATPVQRAVSSVRDSLQGRVASALSGVRSILLGRACPQCQCFVMHHMDSSLKQASMCLSFVALGISTAITIRQTNWHQFLLCWLGMAWGMAHLVMGTSKLLSNISPTKQRAPDRSHPHASSTPPGVMQWMPVAGYALGRLAIGLKGSRQAHGLQAVNRQHLSGTWVVLHMLMMLADQLALYSTLPHRVVTLLGVLDTVLLVPANLHLHSLGGSILGEMLSALLAPILLEVYTQATIGARRSALNSHCQRLWLEKGQSSASERMHFLQR